MGIHHHHHHHHTKHVQCHATVKDHHHYHEEEQRRLLLSIAITALTMIIEAVGGWWTGSLALISDAGHMFSHLFALSLSYVAILLASRPADETRSFGLYRAEILAALINGITLIAIVGWIGYEAYKRFRHPESIASGPMFVIALIGLAVNGATALILRKVSEDDINVRGAFLHVIGDLFSSVGVVIAAVIIYFTGFWMADPIASVLIAAVIAYWSLGLLRDAVHILLQSTPKGISHKMLEQALVDGISDIEGVHHIHIWELTKGMFVMEAHVELSDVRLSEADAIRRRAQALLRERFGITHASLQLQCTPSITGPLPK